MNRLDCTAFTALAVLAAACTTETVEIPLPPELSEPDQATALALAPILHVNERGIDLRCTLSCSVWNVCRADNLSDPLACGAQPPGCCCTSFSHC